MSLWTWFSFTRLHIIWSTLVLPLSPSCAEALDRLEHPLLSFLLLSPRDVERNLFYEINQNLELTHWQNGLSSQKLDDLKLYDKHNFKTFFYTLKINKISYNICTEPTLNHAISVVYNLLR